MKSSKMLVFLPRVHVERVIQRMKIFQILKQEINYNIVHLLQHIIIIVAGVTNLSNPVLAKDKF